MEHKKKNPKKRFYKKHEHVWIVPDKTDGYVKSIDVENLEMTVYVREESVNEEAFSFYTTEKTFKMWEIDKMREKPAHKPVFFAPVNHGVVPTRNPENAGRDAYARLLPSEGENGEPVFELYVERFNLAKIPLGFASYLDKSALLSLKHERSSIGGIGVIVLSGLIDSTYQGEVELQIMPLVSNLVITSRVTERYYNVEENTYYIPYNKAIAQAVVLKQYEGEDIHVPYDFLLDMPSSRKQGKEGSTGK